MQRNAVRVEAFKSGMAEQESISIENFFRGRTLKLHVASITIQVVSWLSACGEKRKWFCRLKNVTCFSGAHVRTKQISEKKFVANSVEDNTERQHRKTTQEDNTGRQHRKTTQEDNTGRQHRKTTQEDNTGRQHRKTTQEDNTRRQHRKTTQEDNTGRQHRRSHRPVKVQDKRERGWRRERKVIVIKFNTNENNSTQTLPRPPCHPPLSSSSSSCSFKVRRRRLSLQQ
ncbi:hypothetical protein FHG87_017986 [Trinorchestia longiramus]|nr:hypothetical protein FHG87_017986 [Trinorchestia longiramus]